MRSMHIKRTLIVSCATILACLSVVAGMTWALFTDTQVVTNHLVAGDLVIKLSRTTLTRTTLDTNTGYLVTKEVQVDGDAEVDFADPTDDNVFGFGEYDSEEVLVPGTKYVATMKVAGDPNRNDVAFKYWVRVDCGSNNALASQLKVTVYSVDADGNLTVIKDGMLASEQPDHSYVANAIAAGDDTHVIGFVDKETTSTFVVEVEFVDLGYDYSADGILSSDNNDAKNQAVDFDLIVYAVQVQYEETTTETETETEPADVE